MVPAAADERRRPHPSPRVLVWRDHWLPGSETFIRNQMSALHRWTPVPVGLYRVDSPISRPSDTVASESPPSSVPVLRRARRISLTRRVLEQVARDRRPDLVHVHFLKDAIGVAPVARRLDLPVIVTVHGFDISSWPTAHDATARTRRLVRQKRRIDMARTFRSVAGIVAVSESIKQLLLQHGAPADRVHVLPIGIPLGHEAPRPEHRAGALFVGRLVAKKGVADLLDAWSRLPETCRRGGLTIVGDGPLRKSLERQADRLELDVTFAGALAPDEVRRRMAAARLLCAPSKTAPTGDVEGLPMVLLEAAAHGLPIAGYRHSGIPEAVIDQETGLLAEEGDVAGLAANIQQLLSDPVLNDTFAEAAFRRVTEHFDIEVCTSRLELLYDDITRSDEGRA